MAGWEGIVDVAKARGASGLLDYEPDAFIFDPYRFAVGDGSEHEVRALLEHVASTDPDVGSYLAAVDKWLHREAAVRSAPVRRVLDFGDVDPDLKGPRLRPWFETATSTQLEKALSWIERADSDDRWRLVSAWKNWGPPAARPKLSRLS